ncbi:MAG TPA: competence protein ComJ [Aquamicrobium sp.]|nr:competence protein ComJ [Aquamicrobium sp.]
MLADFPVTIDHAQVLVHTQAIATPGLLWSEDHVAQGFAWSQGQVAFGVPDHDGECRIRVELAHGAAADPQALWAVQVPFSVAGPVRVGTPFDMRGVAIPDGSYDLIYQAFPGTEGYAYVLRLTFSRSDTPQFRILKTGGDITAPAVLRRDAEPAK